VFSHPKIRHHDTTAKLDFSLEICLYIDVMAKCLRNDGDHSSSVRVTAVWLVYSHLLLNNEPLKAFLVVIVCS